MGLFDSSRKKDDLTTEVDTYNRTTDTFAPADAVAEGGASLLVEDIFFITGRGTVVTGKVANGIFRVGDSVEILREGVLVLGCIIGGLEAFRKLLQEAHAGEMVGILLRGAQRDDVQRGDVVRGK